MKTICVAGKNSIAVNALEYLLEYYPNFNYCIIPNKTDDSSTSWQPSLKLKAKQRKVKEVQLKNIYDIKDLIFLSLEFDLLLRPNLFKTTQIFNIHFSALPKYKGMYTSVFPILNGETESGVTLHKIEKGIDTGDILDQIIFPIELTTTAEGLYQKYLDNAFLLFKNSIESIINNAYSTIKQNAIGSSYYSKSAINFTNISFDFNQTAYKIHNQFRAFTFREYQLPTYKDWNIYKTEITASKSTIKAGNLVQEDKEIFLISSIDYDIKLYKDYYSHLWGSAKNNDIKLFTTAIKYTPNIDLKNKNGWNALILAAYNNNIDIAKMLLKKQSNVNSTNYKGTTVLMYAQSCYEVTNDVSMFQLILSHQPNIDAVDENEKDIWHYIKGKTVLETLLREHK